MNRARTAIATAVIAACSAWPLATFAQAGGSAGSGTGASTANPSDSARATTGNQGGLTSGSSAGVVSTADRNFFAMAASGGMLEVEASRLALERAQSAEIKRFAQQMIEEHTTANQELMTIARSAGVTDVPMTMTARHRGMLERLRALDGQDFERQYAEQIGIAAHHETVALFQRGAQQATHPELKAFAAKTLPRLQAHLQQSQQVASAVDVPADRIQAAGRPSDLTTGSAAAATGAASGTTTSGASGTMGRDTTTGLTDAQWESGRTSSYSLLPFTSYGYVGLNLGRSNWGDSCEGISGIFDCDDSAFSGKIYTGGLISRMVGLEIGYVNFGRPDTQFGNWKAHGVNASIVANLPIDPVNLFARFGTTYGWTTTPAGTGQFSGDDDGFGISYGAGIGFDVTPQFQITAEWDRTRFNFVNGDEDLDMYSIGVRYKF